MCVSDNLREIRPYIKGLKFCLIGTQNPPSLAEVTVRFRPPAPCKIKGLNVRPALLFYLQHGQTPR